MPPVLEPLLVLLAQVLLLQLGLPLLELLVRVPLLAPAPQELPLLVLLEQLPLQVLLLVLDNCHIRIPLDVRCLQRRLSPLGLLGLPS